MKLILYPCIVNIIYVNYELRYVGTIDFVILLRMSFECTMQLFLTLSARRKNGQLYIAAIPNLFEG